MKETFSKDPELKKTTDGSYTLYSNRFKQHYHNLTGAVDECKHVFFEQNGLKKALQNRQKINILEIGFGTGLNLLLLMDALVSSGSAIQVCYHSIEAYPISAATACALNHGAYLNHPPLAENLLAFLDRIKKGYITDKIIPGLELSFFYGLFDDYTPGKQSFDFIMLDAFSPSVNPELWTGNVFEKLLRWSNAEAILSTYCAASEVRGAMAWAGWKVARAGGALGKREMTVASPTEQPLAHLKRVNEVRLAKRYEEGDF